MLDSLITSKMRVQILMRLFLNPDSRAYLRELSQEFGASPGHVRSELQQLSGAGLLVSEKDGRHVQYQADRTHPLYPELQSMVRKALGMDQIVESIVERLGDLHRVYVTGDYSRGIDSGVIDLLLVGHIDRSNLEDLTAKTEGYIGRRIRHLVVEPVDFSEHLDWLSRQPHLMIWEEKSSGGSSTP